MEMENMFSILKECLISNISIFKYFKNLNLNLNFKC